MMFYVIVVVLYFYFLSQPNIIFKNVFELLCFYYSFHVTYFDATTLVLIKVNNEPFSVKKWAYKRLPE